MSKICFIQNPKFLHIIIFILLLACGMTFMSKIKTEVRLSKTLTILQACETENEKLKTRIEYLETKIAELKKEK